MLFLIAVFVIHPEKGHAPRQFAFSILGAQDSIMRDFDEPVGQNVQEKAANELGGIQGHQLDLIIVVAISILECHTWSPCILTSRSLEMATR